MKTRSKWRQASAAQGNLRMFYYDCEIFCEYVILVVIEVSCVERIPFLSPSWFPMVALNWKVDWHDFSQRHSKSIGKVSHQPEKQENGICAPLPFLQPLPLPVLIFSHSLFWSWRSRFPLAFRRLPLYWAKNIAAEAMNPSMKAN